MNFNRRDAGDDDPTVAFSIGKPCLARDITSIVLLAVACVFGLAAIVEINDRVEANKAGLAEVKSKVDKGILPITEDRLNTFLTFYAHDREEAKQDMERLEQDMERLEQKLDRLMEEIVMSKANKHSGI